MQCCIVCWSGTWIRSGLPTGFACFESRRNIREHDGTRLYALHCATLDTHQRLNLSTFLICFFNLLGTYCHVWVFFKLWVLFTSFCQLLFCNTCKLRSRTPRLLDYASDSIRIYTHDIAKNQRFPKRWDFGLTSFRNPEIKYWRTTGANWRT